MNYEEDDDIIDPIDIIQTTKKVNYLNNKDMLKEIHKSKNSFCEFISDQYYDYDAIVEKLEDIFNVNTQAIAKINRANRLSTSAFDAALSNTDITKKTKPKLSEFKIDSNTINTEDLVFRVLTFEHIPQSPGRKKNPKSTSDLHAKLNFYPYKHYIIKNGEAIEVGKSHYKKGKFKLDGGSITNKLAKMFILLVNKYAQRTNWRGYSYVDEMKGQALLQLSSMGLQFDENKSDNPFAYYTSIISTSFTRVLNSEKKTQDLRDDMLINMGSIPSFSKQLEIEDEIRRLREDNKHDDMPF